MEGFGIAILGAALMACAAIGARTKDAVKRPEKPPRPANVTPKESPANSSARAVAAPIPEVNSISTGNEDISNARKSIGLCMVAMHGDALQACLKEGLEWNEAFSKWNSVYENAQYVLGRSEATDEEKVDAHTCVKNSILGMGKALYELEAYSRAVKVLEDGLASNITDDRAKIILGLAYCKTATLNASQVISNYKAAYPLLCIAKRTPSVDLDSKYLYFALGLLKHMYITSIPEIGMQHNASAAYNCDLLANSLPDLPVEAKDFLSTELQKYHKDKFGRYTYSG